MSRIWPSTRESSVAAMTAPAACAIPDGFPPPLPPSPGGVELLGGLKIVEAIGVQYTAQPGRLSSSAGCQGKAAGIGDSGGRLWTIFTVSTLTVTTRRTSRTIYSGSSVRFGSVSMPLRLSVLT